MKTLVLASLLLASILARSSAAIVFSDNFDRADTSTIGNNWAETSTGSGDATIVNNELRIAGGTSAGRTYISQNTTTLSGYASQLNQNAGVVTWTFNMRTTVADPSGFGNTRNGIAFVLGTSSSDFLTGTGYAIVSGQSGSSDPIRLVRYTAGLITGSTITDVITASGTPFGDMGTEFLSIKVTYDPANDNWALSGRDDGTGFLDPTAGVLTPLGTAIDGTYTSSPLSFMGAFWNYSTTTGNDAFFDNTSVDVQAVPEPANIALSLFAGCFIAFTTLRHFHRRP